MPPFGPLPKLSAFSRSKDAVMNRVRISVILGLLALVFLFSSEFSFAAWPGDCHTLFYTNSYGPIIAGTTTLIETYAFNDIVPSITRTNVFTSQGALVNYRTFIYAYKEGGIWFIHLNYPASNTLLSDFVPPNGVFLTGQATSSNLDALYPGGCPSPSVCSSADTDNDSVCDSCDKNPGAPDPNDCIYLKSVNAKGQTVDLIVDEGCTGQTGNNLVSYRNEANALDGGEGKLTFDLTPETSGLSPKTCNASTPADDQGQCGCAYPSGSPLTGFTNVGPAVISDTAKEIKENLQAADNQGQLNDCASIISRCESSCSTHGGVKSAQCNSDSLVNKTLSNCYCNGDLSYGVVNDSPSNTTSSPDSDGDGIPDSSDVTSTGGTDANNDGVDDLVSAVKSGVQQGIASSGIDNAITSISSSVNSVGNRVAAVGDKVDSLGSTISSINDKLGDGIVASGDAALPEVNSYDASVDEVEENSFSDAISDFISDGLPLINYFRGTYISVDSTTAILSTEIYGKTISIDFTGTEDILHFMGLVLVAISTILAFMIIVHKG